MKILILFLMSLSIFAQVDLSQYDLKTSQVEIIRKFEASGKYTEEFLHKFARAAHNQNQAEIRRQNMYIPEYTEDELKETILWARGGAFAAYADYAGFRFLGEAYRADCPNVGLFRFGRASGTEFIPQDVMREAINTSHALQTAYARDRDQFPYYFIELAKKYGFAIYLEEVED